MNRFVLLVVFLLTSISSSYGETHNLKCRKLKSLDFIKDSESHDNLSGVTWSPVTKSYFLILNSRNQLFEADINFKHLNTYNFEEFGDTEEIVYVGKKEKNGKVYPEFAIISEYGDVFIGTIGDKKSYTKKDFLTFNVKNEDTHWGNKGFEGLAYDHESETFYAAKELKPMRIYSFPRPKNKEEAGNVEVTLLFNDEELSELKIKDISGLFFNQDTNRLLVLSHESFKLLDMTLSGEVVNKIKLPRRPIWEFYKDQYQFEGVALAPNGDVVLTSEPYLYRQFTIPSIHR